MSLSACRKRSTTLLLTVLVWTGAATPAAAQEAERLQIALIPVVVHTAEDPDYLRAGIEDMLVARLEQVGALEVGEFVTVLETRTLPNGQLRARFQYTLQKTRLGRDGGWTSVTTSDGERMMGAACPRNWLPARSRRSRRSRRAVQSASKTERLACLRAFLRGGPLPRNLLCRS